MNLRTSSVVIALCLALALSSCTRPTEDIPKSVITESTEYKPSETLTVPTKQVPLLSNYNRIDNVMLTHYCICEKCCGKTPDHPAYGITASGRAAEPYISIAVDPSVIPLGSTVWLKYSDGRIIKCRADDTGDAISNAHVDLCVSSHNEALELGIDYVTVFWEVNKDVLQ